MKNYILVVIIGFITIINNGCRHEHHQKHEPLKLKVTNPVQQDTTIFKEYVCQIRSIQHIEIRALEKGLCPKKHKTICTYQIWGTKMMENGLNSSIY